VCAAVAAAFGAGGAPARAGDPAQAGDPARAGEAPAGAPAVAATPPAAAAAADPLSVYVLTFGPGDHPFFKFGHNALLVRDRRAGTDRVYNFGTFKFDSPKLIRQFLRGRLTYWLSVSTLPATLATYQRENRDVAVQELALPPAEKRELQTRLDENARPENRDYKYDYFLDNCSTRVRDAVDRATGGALHAAARAPGRLTLREQALRMTADYLPLYLALDIALSGVTDRPVDSWAEMYIPDELARGLRTVKVPGPSGEQPLVVAEQTLFRAQRGPPPAVPPARGVTLLLVGLGLALMFVSLGWAAPERPMVRAFFGLLVAAWGLVVGFVGSFLVFVWLFTDHVVGHHNENIMLCAPWALALGLLGVGVALGRPGATTKALHVAVAGLLLALAGWGLKAHPAFHQHNAALIGLFLPPWFGISAGLLHTRHGT
jgi:Domain of unknown function (DUF4105)